jgi:hypothetical protein
MTCQLTAGEKKKSLLQTVYNYIIYEASLTLEGISFTEDKLHKNQQTGMTGIMKCRNYTHCM